MAELEEIQMKGEMFLTALLIGVIVSNNPKLSAKYNNKENFINYTKGMGDSYGKDDTFKKGIPLH